MEPWMILSLPILGTAAGAALVFCVGCRTACRGQTVLTGFAAGIMLAASVWSLLIPSMERSGDSGAGRVIPAAVGFLTGAMFVICSERVLRRFGAAAEKAFGSEQLMLPIFVIILHNLPEGMAVGAALAAVGRNGAGEPAAGALALSLAIAIQNIPEGAIISLPMQAAGKSRGKSFGWGVLSGAVEPAGSVATLLLARFLLPSLPYLMAFAAGAMVSVVTAELAPDLQEEGNPASGTLALGTGFVLMMVLDVLLG